MLKTIETPSGKKINLLSSAAFFYIYNQQFGRDPFKDVFEIANSAQEAEGDDYEIISGMSFEHLYDLTWALAKCYAVSNGKPDIGTPLEFFVKYDDFKIMDYIDTIIELATGSMISNVEIKKTGKEPKKK